MRTSRHSSLILLFLFSTGFAQIASAQSVSMLPVSGMALCAGDTVTASFTATAYFGHKNAFTLQLSDATGSFSNGFENIGSIFDTLPGTFTIAGRIPLGAKAGVHYRLRVQSAVPYTISGDNGADIAVTTHPVCLDMPSYEIGSVGNALTLGVEPCDDRFDDDRYDTAFWDLGSGANPATATTLANYDLGGGYLRFLQSVTYSSAGEKTVTATIIKPGGCSPITLTEQLRIYDCSIPSVPAGAIVVNSDTDQTATGKTYWVNPGFTLKVGSYDTVFAEPGSTINTLGLGCLIYLKAGSVLSDTQGGENTVIYGDGAGVTPNSFTISCPTLDFDYTDAPPNAAHASSAVKPSPSQVSLTLSPNPTSGILAVQGWTASYATVSIFNTLGETLITQSDLQGPNFSLDLSSLTAGSYYVRLSSGNSVVTKKVIKE